METDLSGDVVVTDDVDDSVLLELIEDAEIQCREAERRKLRYALEWARRHVVGGELDSAHWTDADLRDVEQTIGGEGTPVVASGCVEAFATALGVSTRTARQLLSDALDLYHRLPRVWARMETLEVAPWRARRIAAATHALSAKAAGHVDDTVAGIADSCGPVRLDRVVAEAVARFDPLEQAEVEDEAKAAWGVRLDDYHGLGWAGTSRLEIIGDTPTPHRMMDDGGPPGQTRPDNLAPLCRRHHRAKTFRGWTYLRNSDRSYTWTSPHDRQFTVSPDGIVLRRGSRRLGNALDLA